MTTSTVILYAFQQAFKPREYYALPRSTFRSLHPQPNTLRSIEGAFLDCSRLPTSTNMMQVSGVLLETRGHEMKPAVAQTKQDMVVHVSVGRLRPSSANRQAHPHHHHHTISSSWRYVVSPHVYEDGDATMFTRTWSRFALLRRFLLRALELQGVLVSVCSPV